MLFLLYKKINLNLFSFPVSNAQIIGGDRDVFVQESSDLSLTCRAADTPRPPAAVAWLKDGRRIDQMLSRGGITVVTESRRRSSTAK